MTEPKTEIPAQEMTLNGVIYTLFEADDMQAVEGEEPTPDEIVNPIACLNITIDGVEYIAIPQDQIAIK